MKIFKKLSALVLICILALSATGCHKKNEIAVEIDGFKFTSAYYMCALINAKSEAQAKVYEDLSEEEQNSEIDYYSKKIDKKSFVDWTEDRAIETLKEIAAYKSLCKKADIKLDDETKSSAEYLASYYWQNGYYQFFEPNGVSFDTYKTYTIDSYYSGLYFEHLYGKEGEKEINADEVKTKVYESFITANILDVTFSQETDDEKTDIKTKLDTYLADLQANKTTFEKVYKEYNKITDEQTNQSAESDEPKPKDEYASILGKEDTGYDHDNFEEINKMAIGEMKIIEKENKAGYLLVIKQDIKADSFYLDNLDLTARHLIKDEEYEKDIQAVAKDLKADVSKYAIGQFKVKKIVEPSYQ